MMIIINNVKCNMCDCTFTDNEVADNPTLELMKDENGWFWGCPNCKTDAYLCDYQKEVL